MNPRRNSLARTITAFLAAAFLTSAANAQVPGAPPPTQAPTEPSKTLTQAETDKLVRAAKAELAAANEAISKEAKAKIEAINMEAKTKKEAATREAAAKTESAKRGATVVVSVEKLAPPPSDTPGTLAHIQISSAALANLCTDQAFWGEETCRALRKGRTLKGQALRNRDTLCDSDNTAKAGTVHDVAFAKTHDRACGRPDGFARVYAVFVKNAPEARTESRQRYNPCVVWDSVKASIPEDTRADLSATLERECARTEPVAGALPVELIATSLLQGTGDFLKARAKQELIAYAVDQLGRHACKTGGKVRTFLSFEPEPFVFDNTCKTAFGASAEGVLDYQAFTDGRFQKAFERELPDVPVTLLRAVDRAARKQGKAPMDETQAKVWLEIASGLFSAMLELRKTGSAPLDVLKTLDAAVTERVRGMAFTPGSEPFSCSIDTDKDGKPVPACYTLFALRAGGSIRSQNGVVQITETLAEAKKSFCTDYALGDKKKDGICVSANQLDQAAVWLDEAIAVLNDLIDVEKARKTLVAGGATPLEVTKKIAPDYAKDVERLLHSTVEVARSSGAKGPTLDWLTAMADASAAVGAIIGQDYPAAAANLKAILALDGVHEAVQTELGTGSVRALSFLLSLGAAKDADNVKLVLEEQAEPLGSYRQKYTDDFVLSLNGFVGPEVGFAHRYSRNNGAAKYATELKPLSALIGLDFSGRWKAQHLGATITALDALGMATVNNEDGGEIDWGGVLVPGFMLRWGIQKSPIVFFLSGQWQPLRKSESTTDGVNDWKGATALYAGFAVDVPILTLYSR